MTIFSITLQAIQAMHVSAIGRYDNVLKRFLPSFTIGITMAVVYKYVAGNVASVQILLHTNNSPPFETVVTRVLVFE